MLFDFFRCLLEIDDAKKRLVKYPEDFYSESHHSWDKWRIKNHNHLDTPTENNSSSETGKYLNVWQKG